MGMFKIFAGFNTPEIMIPLSLLMATALSLFIWLSWTIIQLLRHKQNPKYLFLKLLLANSILFLGLYFISEKTKHLLVFI